MVEVSFSGHKKINIYGVLSFRKQIESLENVNIIEVETVY